MYAASASRSALVVWVDFSATPAPCYSGEQGCAERYGLSQILSLHFDWRLVTSDALPLPVGHLDPRVGETFI